MEIKNGINIEEDLVNNISGNVALLLESLLQIVEIFKILHVFSLGIDQLLHDMVSIGHLGAGDWTGGLIFGVRLDFEQMAALLGVIQDIGHNLSYL